MLALVLRQVPRVLEGAVALRAMKRPLARVRELVPPDVRRARERLPARFARERLLFAERQSGFAFIVRRFCFADLNGCEYLIGAAGRRRELGL